MPRTFRSARIFGRRQGSNRGFAFMTRILLLGAAAAALAIPTQASAQARPSGTQRTQQAMMNDVPHCVRKLGTVSVMDGDDPRGWTQFQLTGPQKLIKVL